MKLTIKETITVGDHVFFPGEVEIKNENLAKKVQAAIEAGATGVNDDGDAETESEVTVEEETETKTTAKRTARK